MRRATENKKWRGVFRYAQSKCRVLHKRIHKTQPEGPERTRKDTKSRRRRGLHVSEAAAHKNETPMPERLLWVQHLQPWSPEKISHHAKTRNTRTATNLQRVEVTFQLARITHDTCTSLPSQPLTSCSPFLMREIANATDTAHCENH